MLARGWSLGDGDGLPAWKRQVLDEVDTVLKPFEPPLLEFGVVARDEDDGFTLVRVEPAPRR